jgi:hypothetical protein
MIKQHCPICDSDNVVIEPMDKNNNSYLCMKCGFMTTDLYRGDSVVLKNHIAKASQLIVDLCHYDEITGLHWFPCVMMHPKGLIYPDGEKDNWSWIFTPIVETTDEEKITFKQETGK